MSGVSGAAAADALVAVKMPRNAGDRVHQRSSQTAIDDSSVQLVLADEDNPLHLFNVTLLRPADWLASLGVEEVGDCCSPLSDRTPPHAGVDRCLN